MIIAHLIHDTPSLRACAATCFGWYKIATPHPHHTITLRQVDCSYPGLFRGSLHPLLVLNKLGLSLLVRKFRFCIDALDNPRVALENLRSPGPRCLSALVNLQNLKIEVFYFSRFHAGHEKYLGRFSPTLRSVTWVGPSGPSDSSWTSSGTSQSWITSSSCDTNPGTKSATPKTSYTPIRGSLWGRLILYSFIGEGCQWLLREFIAAFEGIRFTSMDLEDVPPSHPEACAKTLRTLRLQLDGILRFCKGSQIPQ